MEKRRRGCRPAWAVCGAALCACVSAAAGEPVPASASASASSASGSASASAPHKPVDRSGRTRKGDASYYGGRFDGKDMADGQPMDPDADTAASKTLPLGTKARITNLDTGKSDVVTIKDRGPYVAGRIVDVSPKVADKLDMKKDGVVPVAVEPLKLPPKEPSKESSKESAKESTKAEAKAAAKESSKEAPPSK